MSNQVSSGSCAILTSGPVSTTSQCSAILPCSSLDTVCGSAAIDAVAVEGPLSGGGACNQVVDAALVEAVQPAVDRAWMAAELDSGLATERRPSSG
jgi:hypothetical protein